MKKEKVNYRGKDIIPEEEEEAQTRKIFLALNLVGLAETPFDPFDGNPNSTNKLDDFKPNPRLQ